MIPPSPSSSSFPPHLLLAIRRSTRFMPPKKVCLTSIHRCRRNQPLFSLSSKRWTHLWKRTKFALTMHKDTSFSIHTFASDECPTERCFVRSLFALSWNRDSFAMSAKHAGINWEWMKKSLLITVSEVQKQQKEENRGGIEWSGGLSDASWTTSQQIRTHWKQKEGEGTRVKISLLQANRILKPHSSHPSPWRRKDEHAEKQLSFPASKPRFRLLNSEHLRHRSSNSHIQLHLWNIHWKQT